MSDLLLLVVWLVFAALILAVYYFCAESKFHLRLDRRITDKTKKQARKALEKLQHDYYSQLNRMAEKDAEFEKAIKDLKEKYDL